MRRQIIEDELIELGPVTTETKGGPMGHEDTEGSLFLMGAGLVQD